MTDVSRQVYELYIRTTPDRLWRAITDGAETPHYFFGTELEPAPREPGEPMRYVRDGQTMLDCRVIDADPPRRLVHSFVATHQKEADPESRVTWDRAVGRRLPTNARPRALRGRHGDGARYDRGLADHS